MIQNSSVSIAARLWVGWLRNQNPIPGRNKQFLYFPQLAVQTYSGVSSHSCPISAKGSVPWGKGEVDSSPPRLMYGSLLPHTCFHGLVITW